MRLGPHIVTGKTRLCSVEHQNPSICEWTPWSRTWNSKRFLLNHYAYLVKNGIDQALWERELLISTQPNPRLNEEEASFISSKKGCNVNLNAKTKTEKLNDTPQFSVERKSLILRTITGVKETDACTEVPTVVCYGTKKGIRWYDEKTKDCISPLLCVDLIDFGYVAYNNIKIASCRQGYSSLQF